MLPYSSVLLIVIDGGLKIWCQKIFSQFMVVLCGFFVSFECCNILLLFHTDW